MMTHKQFLRTLGIATVTLVVGGVVAGAMSLSSAPRLRSVYMGFSTQYTTLHDLTATSVVVARIKVLHVGESYRVPFDPPARTPFIPPDQPSPPPTAITPPVPMPPEDTGTLRTDSTVEVLQIIKGRDVEEGDHVTVAQLGGRDEDGNLVLTEGDPLLQEGEQELVFLQPDPRSDKYVTAGGGQGRFAVTDDDTVRAINPQSPVGAAHDGQSVDAFIAAIKAADRAPDATPTPTGGRTAVP